MSQGKERNGWFGQWLAAMYGRPQTLLVYDPGITGMNRDQALAHFQLNLLGGSEILPFSYLCL